MSDVDFRLEITENLGDLSSKVSENFLKRRPKTWENLSSKFVEALGPTSVAESRERLQTIQD